MKKSLKIIIPTAGWATRMRPQTWSKPKPLVSVAGRTVLDHLLASFNSVPRQVDIEYVIIYSSGLGETQIPPYMQQHHPQLKVHYVLQPVMRGQSDALHLARLHLEGPVIICFSDTLIDADFSILEDLGEVALAWVKPVPDPRRFGVAEVNEEGWVTRLVEKPESLENNRVVVGCYYLPEGRRLRHALREHFKRNTSRNGEFFLTDSLNILLENGQRMRSVEVKTWIDTGTIPATLETNRHLLDHPSPGQPTSLDEETCRQQNVKIVPPVFIHPSARVRASIIGPHVSIAANCQVTGSQLSDCILEAGAVVEDIHLTSSFIGCRARVNGRSAEDPPAQLNIGDDSAVHLKQ
jgi:glucose-1-phosphate thymidylyltransferase